MTEGNFIMKKIFMILAVGIFIFLSGCSAHPFDNNFPKLMEESFKETEREAFEITKNNYSYLTESKLVAYTIDKDRKTSIYVLYKYDNRLKTIPIIEDLSLRLMDHYKYRELYKNQLVIAFDTVIKNSEVSSDGEIIGVLINWKTKDNIFSLCDLDGDGEWDYFANNKGYFSTNPAKHKEGEIKVTPYNWIGYSTLGEKQKLSNLSQEETMKTFERRDF